MNNENYAASSRNKKIGLFLIIAPFVGIIATLILWPISAFLLSSVATPSDSIRLASIVLNVLFGFIGLVCVFGIVIGVPVGIIFLAKKEVVPGAKYDERSGKKGESVVPLEIHGWNWGGAGLTWIWGLYHGVWISLLAWIPLVNFVMIIMLGLKGNEWAWRARKWESVESFKASQQKWAPFGMIFFILTALGLLSNIFQIVSALR